MPKFLTSVPNIALGNIPLSSYINACIVYRARMNCMGLKFVEVHRFGQAFVLILKRNNLGLSPYCESTCPIHISRNCAGSVMATDGCVVVATTTLP